MRGGALGRRVGRGGDARTLGGLGRTREREGERDAGPAGKRSGPTGARVARKVGPQGLVCWARERVELGLVLGRAAWVGKGAGWAATGFGLGFLFWFFLSIPPFLILILFLTQTNLFEFKQNLNSTTLCTQAYKINAPA